MDEKPIDEAIETEEIEGEESIEEPGVQITADLSGLEAEQRGIERGRISLPEAVIVILAAGFVDFFELLTAFTGVFPFVGLVSAAKGFFLAAKVKTAGVIVKIISAIGKVIGLGGPIGKAIGTAIKIITIPAKLIITGVKAAAAGLVAIGTVLVVVGVMWWLFTFSFGLIVSASILVWSILRGAHYMLSRRLIIILAGIFLDAATAGALPTRSMAVLLVIWLNNKSVNEDARKIQTKIEGVLDALGRFPARI